jgi:hypothetical protein
MVDAAVAEVKTEQAAQFAAAKARAREAEANRHRYTRDELLDALLVRDRYGWAHVIRVNEKTIVISAGFGPRKIPFDRVLEVRAVNP